MRVCNRLYKTRSILTVLFFLTILSVVFLIYSIPREIDSDVRDTVGRAALQELSGKGKSPISNQIDLNLKPVAPLVPPALLQPDSDKPQPKTSTSKAPPNVTTISTTSVSTQSTTKAPVLDNAVKKDPAKSLQLPSQIFRSKTHPVLRYPAPMAVASDLLQELSRSRLVLQDLNEKALKSETDIHNMKPNFDQNSVACRCERISDPCQCCLQIAVKQVKFEHQACINFTYLPSKQALRLVVSVDNRVLLGDASARWVPLLNEGTTSIKNGGTEFVELSKTNVSQLSTSKKPVLIGPVAKEATTDPEVLILAEDPPLVCVGDVWSLCTHFYLVTYEVLPTATHKTRLRGCLDVTIQFQNQMIQFYHAGCFTAQSKQNEKDAMPPLFHVPGLT